jgi:four helix bundle protein
MEPSRAIESYRDLEVWKRGLGLAKACYVGTRQFPKEEVFGLTSQIRRASSAIPANIAEGWGRDSRGDYVRFLRIASGSIKELETHLILSMEIGILQPATGHELLATCDELGRMLRALIRKLDPT